MNARLQLVNVKVEEEVIEKYGRIICEGELICMKNPIRQMGTLGEMTVHYCGGAQANRAWVMSQNPGSSKVYRVEVSGRLMVSTHLDPIGRWPIIVVNLEKKIYYKFRHRIPNREFGPSGGWFSSSGVSAYNMPMKKIYHINPK